MSRNTAAPTDVQLDVRPPGRIEFTERQRDQQQRSPAGKQLNRAGGHSIDRPVDVRRQQAPRGPQDRGDAECGDRPWRPADRTVRCRQYNDHDAAEPRHEAQPRRGRYTGSGQPAQEYHPQRDRRGKNRAEAGGHRGQRYRGEPLAAHQQQHAGDHQVPQLPARGPGTPARGSSEHDPGEQEDQCSSADRRHRADHQLHSRNRRAPARIEREQQEHSAIGGRHGRPPTDPGPLRSMDFHKNERRPGD